MSIQSSNSLLNKIHHTDCFDLLKQIPDMSIDMILCDLPYGTTQAFYDSIIPLEPLWEAFHRIIKSKGAIVLTAMQPFSSMLVSSNMQNFRYEWIWKKTRKTNFLNVKRMPLSAHEVVLIFGHSMPNYYPIVIKGEMNSKGGGTGSKLYGDFSIPKRQSDLYYPDTVLEFQHDKELMTTKAHRPNKLKTHPNQKPIALFEYLIKTYTQENEIVLDVTCGSGTTAMAARKCNRQFICGDNHLEYVELARQRLQTTDPFQNTVFNNGEKQLSLFRTSNG